MLEDVRKVTLDGVDHLSKEQLYQTPIEGEYPVGSFLMHFAECDVSWLEMLSGIEQSDDLKKRSYYNVWYDPSEEASPPPEPLEIKVYLDTIAETRKNFLDYVSTLSDEDLESEVTIQGRSGERRIKKKWIIYHIIEHEAHHRGQMFMLIRKAGWNKKNNS